MNIYTWVARLAVFALQTILLNWFHNILAHNVKPLFVIHPFYITIYLHIYSYTRTDSFTHRHIRIIYIYTRINQRKEKYILISLAAEVYTLFCWNRNCFGFVTFYNKIVWIRYTLYGFTHIDLVLLFDTIACNSGISSVANSSSPTLKFICSA